MNRSTAEVWEDFSQPLLEFIARRVADPDVAEDILQEVFIKIHTNLETLQDQERLVPWLYQVARNKVIDHYRAQRPLEELSETIAVEPEPGEDEPEAHVAYAVKEMLGCLPEKYRQALFLTEIKGVRQTELAEKLGISVSGAKSRVQRGREMLREALLECCHFEFDLRGQVMDYIPRPGCCQTCRSFI
jgi:RNA polymerase sigma-70 factor (ECF subfamily)